MQAETMSAPWGKQQEEELAQVVNWAKERISWELLQCQLKVATWILQMGLLGPIALIHLS